jgi:hypothetical protein
MDISGYDICRWDQSLQPIGHGTVDKEPFAQWWERHQERLSNLHPTIVEQWVYKHWKRSPFSNLPLDQLAWQIVSWATVQILREVHVRRQFGKLQPNLDYEVLHGRQSEPALTMDASGTWNYPIVILHTPAGVVNTDEVRPDVRYCLIEGHQRVRYLNALNARGQCAEEHKVFILSALQANEWVILDQF